MKVQHIELINSTFKQKKNEIQFHFLNGPFNKKSLQLLIKWFLTNYGEKPTLDFLDKLKAFGFSQANKAGISLGLDDLIVPFIKEDLIIKTNLFAQRADFELLSGNITSIEKAQRTINLWNTTSEFLKEEVVENFRKKNPLNPLAMMTFSGARGNISQARQLVGMRGLMADPQGIIVEVPIKSNFKEGITLTEYLISCFGARKGLVDTALRTATSGYLTRRLVDAVEHVKVSTIDCKTNLGIPIRGIYNQKSLIGRVLLKTPQQFRLNDKKISCYLPFFFNKTKKKSFLSKKKEKNIFFKNIIISYTLAARLYENATEIFIRSPLTCQTYKSICQFCYGWDLARGDLIHIGEAVGIIAAQSIGEPGTQLTMRTFHTGGVGIFSEKSFKKYKTPINGIIKFPEILPGHMVRTPQGDIGFLIKYKPLEPTRILLEIKTTKNQNSFYNLQESQLPPGTLLMVQEGQSVKKGDIIAQVSQIFTNFSTLPEIVYPVESKIEGESFFESVNLTKSQQLATFNFSSKTDKYKHSLFSLFDKNFQEFLSFFIKVNKKDLEPFDNITCTNIDLNRASNFWILFSQIQNEFNSFNSFLRIGDSISAQTPLYQLNYYLPYYSKIKRIYSKLAGIHFSFDLSIHNIRYHKFFYSLESYRKKPDLLFWDFSQVKKKKKIRFCWYPENWRLKKTKFSFLVVSKKKSAFLKKNFFFGDLYILPYSFFSYKLPFFFIPASYSRKKKNFFLFFASNLSNIFNKIELYQFFLRKNNNTKIKFLIKNKIFVLYDNKRKLLKKPLVKKGREKTFIQFSYSLKQQIRLKNSFIDNRIRNNQKFYYLQKKFPKNFLSYKQTWVVLYRLNKKAVPSRSSSFFNLSTKKFILSKIHGFPKFSMENSMLSLDYFYSTQFYFFCLKNSRKSKKRSQYFFYQKKNIIKPQILFVRSFFEDVTSKKNFSNQIVKKIDNNLNYYRLNKIKKSKIKQIFSNFIQKRSYPNKQTKVVFLTFQKINQKNYSLSSYLNTENLWASSHLKRKKMLIPNKTSSPLFTKQINSFTLKENKLLFVLKKKLLFREGWFFSKNLIKIQLELYYNNLIKKSFFYNGFIPCTLKKVKYKKTKQIVQTFKNQDFQILSSTLINQKYFEGKLKKLKLQLFDNQWTVPTTAFVTGFKYSTLFGDFISLKNSNNRTYWNNINNKHIRTINLPFCTSQLKLNIGDLFRYHQFFANKFLLPFSGKIIKINKNQITFRRGLPFLASKNSTLFLSHKDIIVKNQVLFTLKSTKLETQDIVQGIPKIERLFEARELPMDDGSLTVQKKLETYFFSALDNYIKNENDSLLEIPSEISKMNQMIYASQIATRKIQQFLVENIIDAYRNQDVFIGEKHVEIIVREMTTRVRILNSGSTGFLPGEILQLRIVETINKQMKAMKKTPAIYDPIVLGITKSVLYSESFLLAASFQEVTRVLTRSAIAKKTDFLLGLHENVILGQYISAGSGFFIAI